MKTYHMILIKRCERLLHLYNDQIPAGDDMIRFQTVDGLQFFYVIPGAEPAVCRVGFRDGPKAVLRLDLDTLIGLYAFRLCASGGTDDRLAADK